MSASIYTISHVDALNRKRKFIFDQQSLPLSSALMEKMNFLCFKWTLRNGIAICLFFFVSWKWRNILFSWEYDFLSFINCHYVSFKWSLFLGVLSIPQQAWMNIIHLWSWNIFFYFVHVPFLLLIVSFSLRFVCVLPILTLCLCTKAIFVLLKWFFSLL